MSRVAVVTGGTGAIGTQICKALANAGRKVAAIGHPSESERIAQWKQDCVEAGFEVHVELVDLADHEAAQLAMGSIESALGPVEILVNAAGITKDARFTKMSVEAWRAVISTNLDSVYNVTQPVFGGMLERGFGRIVNIASVNGQKGQFGQANYAAAKAGMHGVSMSLAYEGARKNVTANTVSPGYIATPMVDAIKPEARAAIEAQIPMGRLGKPEEIARAVAFLTADDAGYITGVNLPVNGGLFISH